MNSLTVRPSQRIWKTNFKSNFKAHCKPFRHSRKFEKKNVRLSKDSNLQFSDSKHSLTYITCGIFFTLLIGNIRPYSGETTVSLETRIFGGHLVFGFHLCVGMNRFQGHGHPICLFCISWKKLNCWILKSYFVPAPRWPHAVKISLKTILFIRSTH